MFTKLKTALALGFFNLQGLALMGLYLLGFGAAMGSALAMKYLKLQMVLRL